MIIQPTDKLMQCDVCGELRTIQYAVENGYTVLAYQSTAKTQHICKKCMEEATK